MTNQIVIVYIIALIQYTAEKTLRQAREMLATLRVGKVVAKHVRAARYKVQLANAARDHCTTNSVALERRRDRCLSR